MSVVFVSVFIRLEQSALMYSKGIVSSVKKLVIIKKRHDNNTEFQNWTKRLMEHLSVVIRVYVASFI